MANTHYLIPYLFLVSLLSACGGGGGGGNAEQEEPQLNLPVLPEAPVGSLAITDNYTGFIIGKKPISTDPSSAANQQFSQRL